MLKKQYFNNVLFENEIFGIEQPTIPQNSLNHYSLSSEEIEKKLQDKNLPTISRSLLGDDNISPNNSMQNNQLGIFDRLKSNYDSGINTITKWYQQSVEPGFDDVQKFITQDGRDLVGKIIPGVARSPYEKIRDEFNNYLDNPLKYVHENPGKTALGVGIPGALLAGAGALALRRRQRNVK